MEKIKVDILFLAHTAHSVTYYIQLYKYNKIINNSDKSIIAFIDFVF